MSEASSFERLNLNTAESRHWAQEKQLPGSNPSGLAGSDRRDGEQDSAETLSDGSERLILCRLNSANEDLVKEISSLKEKTFNQEKEILKNQCLIKVLLKEKQELTMKASIQEQEIELLKYHGSQCVTWEDLKAALVNERQTGQQEDIMSDTELSPPSSEIGFPTSSSQPPQVRRGAEDYQETMEALKSIGHVLEKHETLEARMECLEDDREEVNLLKTQFTDAAVEDRMELHLQITELRNTNHKRDEDIHNLKLKHRELQAKMDNLEPMLNQILAASTAAAEEPVEPVWLSGIKDLTMKMNKLFQCFESVQNLVSLTMSGGNRSETGQIQTADIRNAVQTLNSEMESVKQDIISLRMEENRCPDAEIEDKLKGLQDMLDNLLASSSSISLWSLAQEEQEPPEDLSDQEAVEPTWLKDLIELSEKMSELHHNFESLNDIVTDLVSTSAPAKAPDLTEDEEYSLLKFKADFEELHGLITKLSMEREQDQNHVVHLYRSVKDLDEKKAEKKAMKIISKDIKADMQALEIKVIQGDTTTGHLNTMLQHLLNKSAVPKDYSMSIEQISRELDCKVNHTDLDPLKKQLRDLNKTLMQLKSQSVPETVNAAGLKTQLNTVTCLSCDRTLNRTVPPPKPPSLPQVYGFKMTRNG